MAEVQDGDVADYVRARWVEVFRSAYLLTGNRDDAHDLCQTVFERFMRARSTALRNPDAYCHTILMNEWRSQLRARARRARMLPFLVPRAASADDTAPLAEKSTLRAALLTLPPTQRAIVVLRVWLDLSATDTAARLGCSVSSVNSQLSRGLRRLRDELAPTAPLEGP